jgi:hypothetical protein
VQVWKRPQQAKGRYKQCIDMALSLTPKVFNGHEWFDQAESFLRAEQEAQRAKEAAEWTEARKPHVEALKDVLVAMDELGKDDVKLLKHVYTAHPPKKETHTQKTDGSIKSQYKHALIHYHPDKQDVEVHGVEWKVRHQSISSAAAALIMLMLVGAVRRDHEAFNESL